jgi:chromosome segregation and condensation protein ScpB
MTNEQIAKQLGCTAEQVRRQFAQNAKTLRGMESKAVKTGNRVNHYTAAELASHASKFEAKAKK